MAVSSDTLPRWVDIVAIPLINLTLAFLAAGLIVLAVGESPVEVLLVLINGAFGFEEAIGYTLYYATNFIFTGLAVSVAFHAGLFNIGGEGQAAQRFVFHAFNFAIIVTEDFTGVIFLSFSRADIYFHG